jgi:peptidoglycan/xylan/chitin deacetylase (PgdA/CDA1 family)
VNPVVLCYHGVSETWPAETSVTPSRLEEHLTSFVTRGYVGATLTDAVTSQLSPRTLVVTFDDAPRSLFVLARPILASLGLPATVFVPTAFPGSADPMAWSGQERWVGTEHEHELQCMSWDELGTLADEGWEVGAHTRTHPRLTQVADDATLEDELAGARADCEDALAGPCRSLAYPYGDHDDRVVAAAQAAGYAVACTTPRRAAPQLALRWPRVGVYHADTARRLRARVWRRGLSEGSLAAQGIDAAVRAARTVRA